MKIKEQTLCLWEREPMQHKEEIYAADKQISEEFEQAVEDGKRYYLIYEPGTPEYVKAANEDIKKMKLMTRLSNLSHKVFMTELGMSKKQRYRSRIVVSNDASTLIKTTMQYDLQRYLKNFPIMGEA